MNKYLLSFFLIVVVTSTAGMATEQADPKRVPVWKSTLGSAAPFDGPWQFWTGTGSSSSVAVGELAGWYGSVGSVWRYDPKKGTTQSWSVLDGLPRAKLTVAVGPGDVCYATDRKGIYVKRPGQPWKRQADVPKMRYHEIYLSIDPDGKVYMMHSGRPGSVYRLDGENWTFLFRVPHAYQFVATRGGILLRTGSNSTRRGKIALYQYLHKKTGKPIELTEPGEEAEHQYRYREYFVLDGKEYFLFYGSGQSPKPRERSQGFRKDPPPKAYRFEKNRFVRDEKADLLNPRFALYDRYRREKGYPADEPKDNLLRWYVRPGGYMPYLFHPDRVPLTTPLLDSRYTTYDPKTRTWSVQSLHVAETSPFLPYALPLRWEQDQSREMIGTMGWKYTFLGFVQMEDKGLEYPHLKGRPERMWKPVRKVPKVDGIDGGQVRAKDGSNQWWGSGFKREKKGEEKTTLRYLLFRIDKKDKIHLYPLPANMAPIGWTSRKGNGVGTQSMPFVQVSPKGTVWVFCGSVGWSYSSDGPGTPSRPGVPGRYGSWRQEFFRYDPKGDVVKPAKPFDDFSQTIGSLEIAKVGVPMHGTQKLYQRVNGKWEPMRIPDGKRTVWGSVSMRYKDRLIVTDEIGTWEYNGTTKQWIKLHGSAISAGFTPAGQRIIIGDGYVLALDADPFVIQFRKQKPLAPLPIEKPDNKK